ncbi:lipopolysaccharide-induced tumor necrosis factor-alpha factor-like [Hermetia illucens]|uniref:lipopolysaccharide-induced tumor necrosis factor-alpha factor-like n=1 Tax=Hermetia illucens TaxID=343691 RepID=UPI0018CC37F7|nr:lipopolysaccharide-induced tumor necrosis factor-alpha factor-like [Hermetia illucens]
MVCSGKERSEFTKSIGCGPFAIRTKCPNCHKEVVSEPVYRATTNTHIIAILLCIFVLWPFCCLPYFTPCCQSIDHFCPYCGVYIGTFSD